MDYRTLDLLLDSSSSEDEDILTIFNWTTSTIVQANAFISRNERNSIKNFEYVVERYTDEEFRQHFRLSRKTAALLTAKYATSRFFKKGRIWSGRKCISAEIQCLSFLWFAGNKCCYREVANLFNITLSSVYRCQTQFLEFLFHISPTYIKMPSTAAEKEKISHDFARLAGFENTLGCIDGSYIYIRNPAHKIRSTYVNRHGLLSITLQGICDADKKFMDVFVGATSKIHDARIFRISNISKNLSRICEGKYHILGDAAYPLREYLLTPYRDYGDLTDQQKKYNKKHCQTRVKIENTFGLLKQRFRQLTRLDFHTVCRMAKFVLGCCVLHNLCIEEEDLWLEALESEVSSSQNEIARPDGEENEVLEAFLLADGERKRNTIAAAIR